MIPRLPVVSALFLLAAALPAGAQSLRIRLTEAVSQRPLAGAIVEIVDSTGAVATQSVLGEGGRRVITLPRAGAYRVRLRRIGFEPFLSAPVLVSLAGPAEFTAEVPGRRVVLGAMRVVGGPRCARDAFSDREFASLWEEVRKALVSTVLARENAGLELEMRTFRRRLSPERETDAELVGLPHVTQAARPFIAASAEELSQHGYVRDAKGETEYLAPDERVLLSDQFIDEHCFTTTRGEGANEGQFGVQFAPAARRRVADIEGTIWLDSASAELRYLNFWYVYGGLPPAAAGEDKSGGQIIFDRTAQGAWIVSAWRLRMPHFNPRVRLNRTSRPDWYEEIGGVVAPARGDTTPPPTIVLPYRDLLAPARISGTIYDSLAGQPLVGAQVWAVPIENAEAAALGLLTPGRLAIEPRMSPTDASGHYAMDGLPAGAYRIGFEHAMLDSLAIVNTRFDVRLRPGATVLGDIFIPSLATLAYGCASPARTGILYGGFVTGVVRAAGDDRPLQNALVRASWMDFSRVRAGVAIAAEPVAVETRTDSAGVYRICGVPDGVIVSVGAAGPHSSSGQVDAIIGSAQLVRVNLRLAEVADGETSLALATVTGTVSDSSGHPVSDAVVSVDGLPLSARTGADGRFRLAGVMPGSQTIEVRRVGAEVARTAVDLVPGATSDLRIAVIRAQVLDAMLVSAVRNRTRPEVTAAIRRHRNGTGILRTGEAITSAPSLQSMVQGLPGVRTSMGESAGGWVATMRGGGNAIRRGTSDCTARIFMDGREIGYDPLGSFTPAEIAAVEVYVRAATAPMFTAGRSLYGDDTCGVILFWTKG